MRERMATVLVALAFLLPMAVSCVPECAVRTGDILFLSLPSEDDTDTSPVYIHASILEVCDDGIWVVDATARRGVDRHPLDTTVSDFTRRDGSLPRFEVMRLRDADDAAAAAYAANALAYLGEGYDTDFMPGNGKHYCTELIYDSYADASGHVFAEGPMDFTDASGAYPSYWTRIFSRIGAEIPQGRIGTTPRAMRSDPALVPVDVDLIWK